MDKELIEELRIIGAYGEALISGYEARKYANAMEEMETENASLHEQLAEQVRENKILRERIKCHREISEVVLKKGELLEHDLARVTTERDILHEDNSKLRAAICVFCKENSRLEGMISGCARCRYNPKGADL